MSDKANKMKDLAELIGVELGKPFKLKGLNGCIFSSEYALYDTGLWSRPSVGNNKYAWVQTNEHLIYIVRGVFKVVNV